LGKQDIDRLESFLEEWQMSERGLDRIIIKNTAFITLGKVTLKTMTFLFSVFVVRRLGDSHFGQYSTVLAFVGLFQIFAELGMSQYVMREIAQDRTKTQSLFWNLVALRLLLAILGIIGITLGAVAVGYTSELVLGIFIYTCSFLLAAFHAPLTTVLTANERLDYVTGLNILGQLIFVSLGSVFLFSGRGFISLIIANLISFPLQIGLAIWIIRRHHMATLSLQIEPRTWSRLIRAGLPFGIISLMLSIAFSIDTVMLSMYRPDYEVGWYNVAYNLVFSLMFFVSGFNEAIVPSLSRTYVKDPVQVERWYHRSVKFIVIFSLPIAVGGLLTAFPLIRFLYTGEFLSSAQALQVLIWDVPLIMFASFCGRMTTIISAERAAARVYAINTAANVILNWYAIPRFGFIGASVVTVITDLISALQFYFLLRHKLNLPDMKSVFVRVAIASALMGVAVRLAGNLSLFMLTGLGGLVYGGLALALRLVDETERTLIIRLLRKRSSSQTPL
jgi:O-antigen/teichoic acid export membrane protein